MAVLLDARNVVVMHELVEFYFGGSRSKIQFKVAILYGRLGVERPFFGLLSEDVRSKELRTRSSLDTELVTPDCEKGRESRALTLVLIFIIIICFISWLYTYM